MVVGEFAFGVVSQRFFFFHHFSNLPQIGGGGRGGEACVYVYVCHWLRLFIGGEKKITMQKFLSCLTCADFELRIDLGTERPGEALPAPWWEAWEGLPFPTG